MVHEVKLNSASFVGEEWGNNSWVNYLKLHQDRNYIVTVDAVTIFGEKNLQFRFYNKKFSNFIHKYLTFPNSIYLIYTYIKDYNYIIYICIYKIYISFLQNEQTLHEFLAINC